MNGYDEHKFMTLRKVEKTVMIKPRSGRPAVRMLETADHMMTKINQ